MRLEVATYNVGTIEPSDRTEWEGGTLYINVDELTERIAEDPAFLSVSVELARPGEDVRLVHLLDQIEPRLKVAGRGVTFPGLMGSPTTVGHGRTNRLAGVCVMQSGGFPVVPSGLLVPRESVVDMTGDGAPYTPFSTTNNVVLVFRPNPDLSNEDYDRALRQAGLKAALYLAEVTRDKVPDEVQVYELTEVDKSLPRVVYINQLQSQGLFAQTYIYGYHGNDLLPSVMHPNEFLDTAVVNGVYVYASVNTPTYFHLNNPIIEGLYKRHGKSINFVGVVISKGHNYSYPLKERSAYYAAKLAEILRADGVIVSLEGSGNAYIDIMLTVKACEQQGMKTVLLASELGGVDGSDFPLVSHVPEADALVSVGGADRVIDLPEMSRVIGSDKVSDAQGHMVPAAGPLRLALEQICCSTNQLGPLGVSTEEV